MRKELGPWFYEYMPTVSSGATHSIVGVENFTNYVASFVYSREVTDSLLQGLHRPGKCR
jgi:hypothetical protein